MYLNHAHINLSLLESSREKIIAIKYKDWLIAQVEKFCRYLSNFLTRKHYREGEKVGEPKLELK